ncbi:MAG: protease modulator HflC [Beijerinckiaceae bacterium]|nr:protease modulator HflC [Beijerinckiaceae bacterium]
MKTGIFGTFGLVALAVIAFIAWNTCFIVGQTEQALVLRFGQVVDVITKPGLNFKLPLVDNVVKLDKLILDVDVPGSTRPQGEEVITADEPAQLGVSGEERKRLVVDAFARYRIADPLRFYQSVGSVVGAQSRLSVVIISSVRRVLGGVRLSDIVREKREQLMSEIKKQVDDEAKNFGIDVIDVRLRRADLPPATSESVFNSMKAQFKQQATDIRSRGEQRAQELRADADRRATIIRAEAQQKADETRGEGDAERNRIFAEAYSKDPDFFAFYRSMQAYETGLKTGDTRMILSPDSPFFKYFADPAAKAPAGAPR